MRSTWCLPAFVALIFFAAVTPGRSQTTLPAGQPLIASPALNAFRLSGANGRATLVPSPGPGFTQAWRIETTADTSPSFGIEWRSAVLPAVARNDVALVRFFARATASSDESGAAFVQLYVQRASPDYAKSANTTVSLSSEWREFIVPFAFADAFAARAAEVVFAFGFKRQTVEIGGIDCLYYGTSLALASLPRSRATYAGQEAGAAWRTAALARIETLRKGDVTVTVVDAAGRPVPGAAVRVAQTRSAFQFGTALPLSRLVVDNAANLTFRRKLLELFNAASPENDTKWKAWVGDYGSGFTRAQTLAGLAWLKNHGFHVRGHVLVWPGWNNLPTAIGALRGTPQQGEIPTRTLAHIADIVPATRDLLVEWDVLNEPFSNHDLMDLFGPAIQADWFRAARAAHPTATLFLNDYANHDASLDAAHVAAFEATARYLLAQGAPLGGLGLQGHIGGSPSPPPNVLAVLDRYAALGLPIRITEFDINTDDEELQADYTRDFLIAAYSHASVVGVQHWGFWEGSHWIPRAAMYRTDWTEKPNGAVYRDLVLRQWRTHASGATDTIGEWRGRGFHGDYTVTVEFDGRTYEQVFTLRPGTAATSVRVPLASPRLVNLSTRASAGSGDATLIPGFFIAGSGAKRVLLRGLGPALGAFGLTGTLARPELSLLNAAGVRLASNRGWDSGTAAETAALVEAAARTGAFALARGSGDAALLATLTPGAYTAAIGSAEGGTGLALVEAYEVDATEPARFRNLSTRAFVGSGQQVAIPGMVIAGDNARSLLVRAIGPGLAAFGVGGTLARPALVVQRGADPIAANIGWESSADPAALITAATRVGAFPLAAGRADSALLATLPAGAYTIQVSGADQASGIVLIEVYDLSG